MDLQLKKDNLILRLVNVSDASILFGLIDKNRSHLGRWFSWVEKTNSVEDIDNFLKNENENMKKGKGFILVFGMMAI